MAKHKDLPDAGPPRRSKRHSTSVYATSTVEAQIATPSPLARKRGRYSLPPNIDRKTTSMPPPKRKENLKVCESMDPDFFTDEGYDVDDPTGVAGECIVLKMMVPELVLYPGVEGEEGEEEVEDGKEDVITAEEAEEDSGRAEVIGVDDSSLAKSTLSDLASGSFTDQDLMDSQPLGSGYHSGGDIDEDAAVDDNLDNPPEATSPFTSFAAEPEDDAIKDVTQPTSPESAQVTEVNGAPVELSGSATFISQDVETVTESRSGSPVVVPQPELGDEGAALMTSPGSISPVASETTGVGNSLVELQVPQACDDAEAGSPRSKPGDGGDVPIVASERERLSPIANETADVKEPLVELTAPQLSGVEVETATNLGTQSLVPVPQPKPAGDIESASPLTTRSSSAKKSPDELPSPLVPSYVELAPESPAVPPQPGPEDLADIDIVESDSPRLIPYLTHSGDEELIEDPHPADVETADGMYSGGQATKSEGEARVLQAPVTETTKVDEPPVESSTPFIPQAQHPEVETGSPAPVPPNIPSTLNRQEPSMTHPQLSSTEIYAEGVSPQVPLAPTSGWSMSGNQLVASSNKVGKDEHAEDGDMTVFDDLYARKLYKRRSGGAHAEKADADMSSERVEEEKKKKRALNSSFSPDRRSTKRVLSDEVVQNTTALEVPEGDGGVIREDGGKAPEQVPVFEEQRAAIDFDAGSGENGNAPENEQNGVLTEFKYLLESQRKTNDATVPGSHTVNESVKRKVKFDELRALAAQRNTTTSGKKAVEVQAPADLEGDYIPFDDDLDKGTEEVKAARATEKQKQQPQQEQKAVVDTDELAATTSQEHTLQEPCASPPDVVLDKAAGLAQPMHAKQILPSAIIGANGLGSETRQTADGDLASETQSLKNDIKRAIRAENSMIEYINGLKINNVPEAQEGKHSTPDVPFENGDEGEKDTELMTIFSEGEATMSISTDSDDDLDDLQPQPHVALDEEMEDASGELVTEYPITTKSTTTPTDEEVQTRDSETIKSVIATSIRECFAGIPRREREITKRIASKAAEVARQWHRKRNVDIDGEAETRSGWITEAVRGRWRMVYAEVAKKAAKAGQVWWASRGVDLDADAEGRRRRFRKMESFGGVFFGLRL